MIEVKRLAKTRPAVIIRQATELELKCYEKNKLIRTEGTITVDGLDCDIVGTNHLMFTVVPEKSAETSILFTKR